MAFQKLTTTATGTKTHAAEDASIIDVLLPTVPLADSTGNLLRGVAHIGIGWLARGYKETGSFGL